MDDFEWFAPLVNIPVESSAWRCKLCGMSGTCVPGDEEMCLRIHLALTEFCDQIAPWTTPPPSRELRLRRLNWWARITTMLRGRRRRDRAPDSLEFGARFDV